MTTPISDWLYEDLGIDLGGWGEPFVELEESFWDVFPDLIFLIVLILVGYLVAKFVSRVFEKLLTKFRFEKAMEKVGVSKYFANVGLRSVSHFLAIFVFWFIFLIFLQIGLGATNVEIISDILSPIVLFIPKALIAALIIVIGLWVGSTVGKWVEKALEKSGLKEAVGPLDEQIKGTGYSLFKILGIIVQVWIILIFAEIAVDILNVQAITDFFNPILLYFPRVVMAFLIILVGLVVADYIVKLVRNWFNSTEMGQKLSSADSKTERGGFSIISIVILLIKVWILLFFVNVALDVLAIGVLSDVINPIILYFPRILVAMIIIIIGLLVTDYIIKLAHRFLKELEASKFIDPIDRSLKKPGFVMGFIDLLIKIFVMLIFIDLAVAVLDFPPITDLLNEVILWLPSVFAAAIIVIIGLWLADWLGDKAKGLSETNDLPFPSMIGSGVKLLIIYIVLTIALAQIGIEVPILYWAFILILGAIMLGVGAGFAFGLKDVSTNIAGFLQASKVVQAGDSISVGEFSGDVVEVTRYFTTLVDASGKENAIPNDYLVRNAVTILSRAEIVQEEGGEPTA